VWITARPGFELVTASSLPTYSSVPHSFPAAAYRGYQESGYTDKAPNCSTGNENAQYNNYKNN